MYDCTVVSRNPAASQVRIKRHLPSLRARSAIVSLALLTNVGAASEAAPSADGAMLVPSGAQAIEILDDVWSVARDSIYPARLRDRFDESARYRIVTDLEQHGSMLASALNPFLTSLGVSHTYFYDRSMQGYYLLRSLFTTRDPTLPALYVLGLQLGDGGRVQAVLDGLPAKAAGIVPGDRIVAVDGRAFASLLDWQRPGAFTLTLEAPGGRRDAVVTPIRMGYHQALLDATRRSVRHFDCGATRIGYLRLWSGTDDAFLETLRAHVAAARDGHYAGYVLDLRDGYGGAWWPYLDPFFPDRTDYFTASVYSADAAPELLEPEPATNPAPYPGPIAVLVNGGTRSGKEALAWQFKKSGRGRLIGSTTAGAFSSGRGVFADREAADYLLYLAVAELRLDGTVIEGVGVAPDERVLPVYGRDVPLAAGLTLLGCDASRAEAIATASLTE